MKIRTGETPIPLLERRFVMLLMCYSGKKASGIEQNEENREWTLMNANKGRKATRKHPQITQIITDYLRGFKRRRKAEDKKFTWMDRIYRIRI